MLSNPITSESWILANLLHFARLLRSAGLPVSSSQIADLAQALTFLDLSHKEDVYHASRCLLVHNVAQFDVFDRAFDLFWLHYQEWLVEFNQVIRSVRRKPGGDVQADKELPVLGSLPQQSNDPQNEGIDLSSESSIQGTYSPQEILREKDFAFLSQEELETARKFIQKLMFTFEARPTRRKVRAFKREEYIDLHRVLRRNLKYGGEILELSWCERKEKPRPIIVLCDISGSMERYSVIFLHFLYALVQEKKQIEAFAFGTRLTYLTPALRFRDVNQVIDQLKEVVLDWSGGTRIGASIHEFNYKWSRRLLRRGAVVLIISDGWDRGDTVELKREISRLRRSVYRLIWLNPLAAQPGYEPLVRGLQAVLPFVDDLLPLNNLSSFESLAKRLENLENFQPHRHSIIPSK